MFGRRNIMVIAALLVTPAAAAAADPTALRLRAGDHPGFVRIVMDRTATPTLGDLVLPDGAVADGAAVVEITRTRLGALRTTRAFGVTVTPSQHGRAVRLRISAAAGRFKYLETATLSGRAVIDLWKAAPRWPGATIRNAGCLSISRVSPGTGRVTAAGIARRIFENQFSVVVRSATGRIVGRREGIGARTVPVGPWSATVPYTVTRRQVGTLEAVDFGGREGHLCLAQVAVILRPA